jgi:hypothetical protein
VGLLALHGHDELVILSNITTYGFLFHTHLTQLTGELVLSCLKPG